MAGRRGDSRSKDSTKDKRTKDTSKTVHFTLLAYTIYTWLKKVFLRNLPLEPAEQVQTYTTADYRLLATIQLAPTLGYLQPTPGSAWHAGSIFNTPPWSARQGETTRCIFTACSDA